MTPKQTAILKSTWRLFMKIDPLFVGGLFYEKLFHLRPEFKKMFHESKEVQSKKFVDMVSMIVIGMDHSDKLMQEVQQMGIRHTGYGVKPAHYEPVGAALLWTLEKGLGTDWTPEVKEAWTACYVELAEAMQMGANEATKK